MGKKQRFALMVLTVALYAIAARAAALRYELHPHVTLLSQSVSLRE